MVTVVMILAKCCMAEWHLTAMPPPVAACATAEGIWAGKNLFALISRPRDCYHSLNSAEPKPRARGVKAREVAAPAPSNSRGRTSVCIQYAFLVCLTLARSPLPREPVLVAAWPPCGVHAFLRTSAQW